jgi:hypothetical protein
LLSSSLNYGGSIGSLAAIDYEPRQARKGAAVVIDSGAEVRLLELPPKYYDKNELFGIGPQVAAAYVFRTYWPRTYN